MSSKPCIAVIITELMSSLLTKGVVIIVGSKREPKRENDTQAERRRGGEETKMETETKRGGGGVRWSFFIAMMLFEYIFGEHSFRVKERTAVGLYK